MNDNTNTVTVAFERKFLGERKVDYRLLLRSGTPFTYSVEISTESECIHRDISCDIAEAACLYKALVKNLVTPCTLDDILEDRL